MSVFARRACVFNIGIVAAAERMQYSDKQVCFGILMRCMNSLCLLSIWRRRHICQTATIEIERISTVFFALHFSQRAPQSTFRYYISSWTVYLFNNGLFVVHSCLIIRVQCTMMSLILIS